MYIKILFFLLLIISSCSTNKNAIYVGTNAEFFPFEYLEDNNIKGFDIDIIKAIGKELDRDIKIKNFSWDGLLPALQSRKIDLIIAAMTITDDRKKIVDFSESYYLSKNQMIIIHKSNDTIKDIESLKGTKLGVALGFTGDMIATKMKDLKKIERFNNPSQAIISLKEKKIDAVLLDHEFAFNYVKNSSDLKLITGNNTQEKYSIAVFKGNNEILDDINFGLMKIKENGRYNEIYQKYFE